MEIMSASGGPQADRTRAIAASKCQLSARDDILAADRHRQVRIRRRARALAT